MLHAQALAYFSLRTQEFAGSTNDDALLRQVKTWILHGWPERHGQELQGFLPYFTRRHELNVNIDSRRPLARRVDVLFSAEDPPKRTFSRDGGPGPRGEDIASADAVSSSIKGRLCGRASTMKPVSYPAWGRHQEPGGWS